MKFAPSNDIVNLNNLSNILSYLIQFGRYQQIFLKFVSKVFLFNDGIVFLMFAYLLFSGLDKRFFNRRILSPPAMVLGLLFGGYYFSYLISPNDLKWHLNSSLYRLLMHIWPSFVFLFFLCTKGAEKTFMNEERN